LHASALIHVIIIATCVGTIVVNGFTVHDLIE
jgi:hypothetical protein